MDYKKDVESGSNSSISHVKKVWCLCSSPFDEFDPNKYEVIGK